jgi:hypothetical protein
MRRKTSIAVLKWRVWQCIVCVSIRSIYPILRGRHVIITCRKDSCPFCAFTHREYRMQQIATAWEELFEVERIMYLWRRCRGGIQYFERSSPSTFASRRHNNQYRWEMVVVVEGGRECYG